MNEMNDPRPCPRCKRVLPVDAFGICRARKDGRNLYCKTCVREKIKEFRRALKENSHRIREKIAESAPRPTTSRIRPRTLVQLIEGFIRTAGICTYEEISREFKGNIFNDEAICEAIAVLMLRAREITYTVIGDTRFYLPADVSAPRTTTPRPLVSDNTSVFMKFNMPQSRTEKPHGTV